MVSLVIEDYLKMEVEMLKERYTSINGYASIHDYILKHGHKFESAALNEEEMAFALAWRRECPMRQCYTNAQRLVCNFSSKFLIGYVEGVATSGLIPTDHAWNTINEKLIDLTWGLMKRVNKSNGEWYLRRTSRVLGVIPDGFEYYGVEISYKDVTANMLAHRLFKPVVDDYECEYPLLRGVKGHTNGVK